MRVAPGKCLCSCFTCFSECSLTLCCQTRFESRHTQQQQQQPRQLQQLHGSPTKSPIPDAAGVGGRGLGDGEDEVGDFGDEKGEKRLNGEHGGVEWGGGGEVVHPADGEKLLEARSEAPRKSILKKPVDSACPVVPGKGRVKWMDFMGKELVEVKEFESNETEDSDEDVYMRRCGCIIQ